MRLSLWKYETPHEIQEEALAALEITRAEGNRAGLVVLATGLGKTWLSAFDTMRPEFRRVLFVAHREEILAQARNTFRQIRPDARLGLYMGSTRDEYAEILFASIQTLGRREHLNRFARDAFDYIVIDEFHHAAAASYRRLIEHFEPQFLLGLTATPERTDGGNLLALCQENLVYRADLREGINRGLLAPFHYFGVPDEVDYTNIPWRSSRFDEEALTNAVATQRRAENSLDQLRKRGGKRTLAFCVSTRHADFMAEFFQESGLRSVAVHSGSNSAPRALSLEHLASGEIDVVCAVDMFNEGVDVPELDTVMMLRPTESRLLWLQQLGRGLRKAAGKTHLNVIDYIGNHRTFLIKPQTLFDLPSRTAGDSGVPRPVSRAELLSFQPDAKLHTTSRRLRFLASLPSFRRGSSTSFAATTKTFERSMGCGPMAARGLSRRLQPTQSASRARKLAWVREVDGRSEHRRCRAVVDAHGPFFSSLDNTEMVKSYKMVVLLAMLNADSIPGEIGIDDLVEQRDARRITDRCTRAPTLARQLMIRDK